MKSQSKTVRIEVGAEVFGHWCVHQAVGHVTADGGPTWMVSHVDSGRSIGSLLGAGTTFTVACRIAEEIASVPCLNVTNPLRVSDMGFMVQAIVADSLEMEPPQ